MKIDELIERVKPKSRKELPFFLLKAAITILIVREMFYDISHVTLSKIDMEWLLFYMTKVMIFGVILYILYRAAKRWKKKGPGHKLACYIFLIFIVFVTPFINGSIFGMLFIDGLYWGKVIDADTGKPISGASVAMRWDFDWNIMGVGSYGDVRETVTDKQGRFFVPVARVIKLWPGGKIERGGVTIYKPGYDSYPSRMDEVWNDEDKEKWLHKLNQQYSEFRKEYSKKYHSLKYKSYLYEIDPKEYFSNPKYAPLIYNRIFGVHWKRFKTNVIKLNKVKTDREKKHVLRIISFGQIDTCDEYKVKRLKDLVMDERRRYGYKTY